MRKVNMNRIIKVIHTAYSSMHSRSMLLTKINLTATLSDVESISIMRYTQVHTSGLTNCNYINYLLRCVL